MQELIETLKTALGQDADLSTALQREGTLCWQADYPVAIVHHESRVKESEILSIMKEEKLIAEKGFTPHSWSAVRIEALKKLSPQYLKTVRMLVHKGNPHAFFLFNEKRPGDYWKKVSDDGSFVAALESSHYQPGTDLCQIEADLRDLMRSSKEVPSLKEIGFIWMVEAPMNLEMDRLLAHYYQKNWMMVVGKQKIVYLGWHERLGSVDMRHFICPPKSKRSEKNA